MRRLGPVAANQIRNPNESSTPKIRMIPQGGTEIRMRPELQHQNAEIASRHPTALTRRAHLALATTAAEGTLPILLWRRGLGRGGSLLTTAGGVDWQGLPPPSQLHKRAPLP